MFPGETVDPDPGDTDFCASRLGGRLIEVTVLFDPTPAENATSSERSPVLVTCVNVVGAALTVT